MRAETASTASSCGDYFSKQLPLRTASGLAKNQTSVYTHLDVTCKQTDENQLLQVTSFLQAS